MTDHVDDYCECGSGLEDGFNPATGGFDCEECSQTIITHDACGTAFYSPAEDDVCDVCHRRAERNTDAAARDELAREEASEAAGFYSEHTAQSPE